jgi:hypothetical protein
MGRANLNKSKVVHFGPTAIGMMQNTVIAILIYDIIQQIVG